MAACRITCDVRRLYRIHSGHGTSFFFLILLPITVHRHQPSPSHSKNQGDLARMTSLFPPHCVHCPCQLCKKDMFLLTYRDLTMQNLAGRNNGHLISVYSTRPVWTK